MRFPAAKLSLLSLFLIASLATPVDARAKDEPDSASDTGPKPTKLKGVLESVVTDEIEANTEQITSFTIERLVPHGTTVKAGQNVVWFESEPISDKMKTAEIEMRLATIAMEEDEFNHKQFLANQKLQIFPGLGPKGGVI